MNCFNCKVHMAHQQVNCDYDYLERLEPELGEYLLGVEGRGRCDADCELPLPRHLQRLADELCAEARVALRRVRRQDEQLQVRVAVVPAAVRVKELGTSHKYIFVCLH